ncbi:MAG: PfkB family carbohydrate kinase [Verrucomicrobiota bacterium]
MKPARFHEITSHYASLRVAVVGDFCLDRYLEIDPAKKEKSIETGLPVYNVVNVRSQPGAAGTIVNNLSALGVGQILVTGFCGEDGEGYELQRALRRVPQVSTEYFFATPLRRTFTYTKPLVLQPKKFPKELNRLDLKNWTPTPLGVRLNLARAIREQASKVDAIIVLDQTDIAGTGVVTQEVLRALETVARAHPKLFILADSRRGLRDFPPFAFKVNRAEMSASVGSKRKLVLGGIRSAASSLAAKNGRPIFVTLAEEGLLAASPDGQIDHVSALPVRGEIDIVGAGDAVTANLTTALASGAGMREGLELARAAASVVIHKLGTTGTANVREVKKLVMAHALGID